MASGNSGKTETKGDERPSTTFSTSFLSVSGFTSTIQSDYLSIHSGISSTQESERTHFQSFSTVSGLLNNEPDRLSEDFSSLDDSETNLGEVKTICYMCFKDEQEIRATHFCLSCNPPDGRYICHRCLHSHDKWCFGHDVVSLCVRAERLPSDGTPAEAELKQLKQTRPEDIDSESRILDPEKEASSSSKETETLNIKLDDGLINRREQSTEEIRILKGPKEDRSDSKAADRKKFYKDELYLDITRDKRYRYWNPPHLSTEGLRKYGTYPVAGQSVTSRSYISGICELGRGKVVLTDSQNCKLTILSTENFKIISSITVDDHPSSVCFIEGEKVAVLFSKDEIKILLLANDIKIIDTFAVKSNPTGLTYGNGYFYLCLKHVIECYSECGEKRGTIRPICNDPMTVFVNLGKIAISKDGDTLYVTDKVHGIVVVDTNGLVLRVLSENLTKPDAVCIDGSGSMFVTEIDSNRVLQINSDDGTVRNELKEVSGDEHPLSLCYLGIKNLLLIGVWSSDNIHVFTCNNRVA